jgi:hypothetical protein
MISKVNRGIISSLKFQGDCGVSSGIKIKRLNTIPDVDFEIGNGIEIKSVE